MARRKKSQADPAPLEPGSPITFRIPRDAKPEELAILERLREDAHFRRTSGYMSTFFWNLLRAHVRETADAVIPLVGLRPEQVEYLSNPLHRRVLGEWIALTVPEVVSTLAPSDAGAIPASDSPPSTHDDPAQPLAAEPGATDQRPAGNLRYALPQRTDPPSD